MQDTTNRPTVMISDIVYTLNYDILVYTSFTPEVAMTMLNSLACKKYFVFGSDLIWNDFVGPDWCHILPDHAKETLWATGRVGCIFGTPVKMSYELNIQIPETDLFLYGTPMGDNRYGNTIYCEARYEGEEGSAGF